MKYTGFEHIAGKAERRVEVSDSLETKRFVLSSNPKIKERLSKLQLLVENLKQRHPEIISLGLHGSMVKGYANQQSDIDGYFFTENSKLTNHLPNQKEILGHKQYFSIRCVKKFQKSFPISVQSI